MPKAYITNTFTRRAKCPKDKTKIVYFDTKDTGLVLEVRATGTKTYYYRYTTNGKTKLKKLADTISITANQARTQVQKLKKNQEHNNFQLLTPQPSNPNPTITIEDFYTNHYLPFIKTSKKSYRQDINFYKNHILPQWKHLPMNELTRAMITQKHISLVQDNNLSPNTANKLLKYLSHTYNLALDWETKGIEINPVAKVKLFPVTNLIERFLTKEETTRLLNAASKVDNVYIKPIIEFLILTGARKTEVLTAKWQYIDLVNKLWTIPLTKSGKVRRVPITPQLETVIQSIPRRNTEYIFPSLLTNKPMKNFEFHWYKIRTAALLEDVRIHDLRHSYASILVNSGRSIYEVQQLLGHSNVSVTQRYAHLSKNSLFEAAECAGRLLG